MKRCLEKDFKSLGIDITYALKTDFLISIGEVPETDEHDNFVGNVYDDALRLKVVTQEWFDERLKHSDFERLTELHPLILNSYWKRRHNNFDFYFNEDTIKHFANDILHFVVMDCDYESKQERKQITIDLAEQITHYLNTLNYENSK